MPDIRYQVVEKSFIGARYYDPMANPDEPIFIELPDTVVPGPNLKAVDEKGKKMKAQFKEQTAKDAKRLKLAADGVELTADTVEA